MKLTKKELLKSPRRDWGDVDKEYTQILIVPTGTKHDSGFMHIAIIGVFTKELEEQYEICAYPDDVSYFFPIRKLGDDLEMTTVRQDCYYPQGVLRFWGEGKFKVGHGLSSTDVYFCPTNQRGI